MAICGNSKIERHVTARLVVVTLLQIFGTIGNVCSLYCLWKCQRTNKVTKIQMSIVFFLLLLLALIVLPGESWNSYLSYYCYSSPNHETVSIVFILLEGFTLTLEKMNISCVAVYRFLAVTFPVFFKKVNRIKILVPILVMIFIINSLPITVGVTQTIHVHTFQDENQYIYFGNNDSNDSTINSVVYNLYCFNFIFPFVVSVISYILMVMSLRQVCIQIFQNRTFGQRDHVTFTIQILVLVDLFLDAPYAIAHIVKMSQEVMEIVHIIFYMHLLIDPLLFLFLNPHNREILLQLGKDLISKGTVFYQQPVTTSSTQHTGESNLTKSSSSSEAHQHHNIEEQSDI